MQEPKSLIRIVTGISMLSLSKLGWDSTVTYREQQPGKICRKIEMPKPLTWEPFKMSRHDTESFILWTLITLQETVIGRATRIWKAYLESDMVLPENARQVTSATLDYMRL